MIRFRPTRFGVFAAATVLGFTGFLTTASAQDGNSSELRRIIDDLRRRLTEVEAKVDTSSHGHAHRDGHNHGTNARVSLDILTSVGGSSKKSATLRGLQGGGHDPKRRGVTLRQAKLSFTGKVDDNLEGSAFLSTTIDDEGETRIELEEAFIRTTSLPGGFEIKLGHFHTALGRFNRLHAHDWKWQDQPVINTRLFGGDAMRGLGAQFDWTTPAPWRSKFTYSAQNAAGENMVSFFANDEVYTDRSIAGRTYVSQTTNDVRDFVHLLRWENGFDVSNETTVLLGISHTFGPNATGREARTKIHGIDFEVEWANEDRSRFVILESEFFNRDFDADFDATNVLNGEEIEDDGGYAQLTFGLSRDWSTGIRYEKARGDSKQSVGGTTTDIHRNNRERISPMVAWRISGGSKLRLQYNYDRAEHLTPDHDAHSFWLGFDVNLGDSHGHGH